MTTDEQAQVAAYVRTLADRLELQDWRYFVERDCPDNPDAAATIAITSGQRVATIKLGNSWRDKTPNEHRLDLTHELLHCHLNPVAVVMEHLETNLGDHVYGVVSGLHRHAIEHAVDAISYLLTPHLPLPNENGEQSEEAA